MNAPQTHLMLNHIPVIGTLFVIVALAAAIAFRSVVLQRFGLAILLGVALLAVPVFLTGEPTEERIEALPGVSKSSIEAHEGAAQTATLAAGVLGILALVGLVSQRARASRGYALGMLVLACGLGMWMAWTAHLGGGIRHPEIRPGATINAAVETD